MNSDFNCVHCFLKTGRYPNSTCGECGRWAAGGEMTKSEIDEYIISAYNRVMEYNESKDLNKKKFNN